jgi:proteasome assembly chaperone (PAC2) family protein
VADKAQLHHPWLVAVWPGMGNVALNAGIYLLAKLGMSSLAELKTSDLFDVEQVEVEQGIIQPAHRPRNRLFLWTDPRKRHDLIVLLGEAQPPIGKYPFCRQLVNHVRELGVERVYTFAAMATDMHPEAPARVFAAATNRDILEELKRFDPEVLEEGNIAGLNGVLLGLAAEAGLPGACLLGEMPQLFTQLPFPKASLAILETFASLTGIELDFTELAEQARTVEQQLVELLSRVEKAYGQRFPAEAEEIPTPPAEEEGLDPAEERLLEQLFEEAVRDRSKAFELKRELDRLGVFKEYEDRFLDLFRKPR